MSKKKRKQEKKRSAKAKLNFEFDYSPTKNCQEESCKCPQKASCHSTNLIPQKILLCLFSLLFALLNAIQVVNPATPSPASDHPPNLHQTTTTTSIVFYD